ncbi:MAG: type IV secretory system conjugative DNA transfer family protein [Bacilli bacterium]|nr:type IV secretory system conjugative DNA transfer family protein [Bacilli bacterium]
MKIKVGVKEAIIFILFALFLLYVVALLILNLSSLARVSGFYGFNPSLAFTKEYLPATITFYILFLVVIFISVKSYIFDTEKGFGISFSENTKGYSRWAKKREMKKALKRIVVSDRELHHAGVPIISDGNEVYVDDGESHSLIVGATASGKTRRFALPMINILAKKGESIIVTDPKAELYEHTAGLFIERGYKVIVLNLRNPQQGNAWNPLRLPYDLYKAMNPDKATELIDDLAINILYDEKNTNDPFWEKTSADYFSGLILGLFEDAKESEINLNSINLMTTVGEERLGASTYIKEYFEMKDPSKPAYISVSSTINAPNETKASILSVFKQKIKLFSSKENLSEMLSYSDFDMKDIGREKTAVYIIIQDEKKTYHPLATTFVKQCYESLIDVAHENGGELPIRTNFILDEFANMPPIKDITTMITAARSRQIRFNLIIQNYAQLNQVYGKENAETIKGNCTNRIYLLSSELGALKEISELCGEVKSKDKDAKGQTRPLISVSELQTLKVGSAIINKARMFPFKTKLPDISQYKFHDRKYEKAVLPQREKRGIDLFDIRAFVKDKKRSQLFNILDDDSKQQMPGRPSMNNNMDFNVDDLVKRIDAKIAELEEEERREKEMTNKSDESIIADTNKKEENSIEEIDSSNLYISDKANNIEVSENHDDDFFDDFFADEE